MASAEPLYHAPTRVAQGALIPDRAAYERLYRESLDQPDAFWDRMAREHLSWIHEFREVSDNDWKQGLVAWFLGGKLNVCENCVDRHVKTRGDQVAILWEGDEPGQNRSITYRELQREVCRMANVLRHHGLRKGDRVAIYMPMIPEAAYAMLACARLGIVHSVIFAGFSAESVRDRILDAKCKAVITADEGLRAKKTIPLKRTVDEAVMACPTVRHVFVVKRTGGKIPFYAPRDVWIDELMAQERPYCPIEHMDSEDTLFLLYTSGSTGKPKGIAHTTAGYLLGAAMTMKYVFDYREGDIHACMADIGWVTGHSYVVYGPLCNGATTVMFESIPTYPDAGRYWDIVQRLKITQFYTAPTAIRAIMREGDQWPAKYDKSSLRVLGSVGEPINPEAWKWYYEKVGEKRCQIVDTFWQTETGSIMITPLPAAIPTKPGSATLPFFGVEPVVLDEKGKEVEGNGVSGVLAFKRAWPSMARTIQNDHGRFVETYLKPFPGYYFTGDGCRRDEDGYWWITGRVDDVINVSGHRMGTAEVESALVSHPGCAEAAVCGYPHEIKGQGIFAYVLLKDGYKETPELIGELRNEVRHHIGPIATPDVILIAPGLPKTRSGKIMRRILRKIAADETDNLGDTSTLADPAVVQLLIEKRRAVVK
ncbi:MAG TPA: acetate--CoA ligase [Planctomycetes bacterium]|nr:acetate--CoA ligase [Planctomycetota bacterium]